MATQPPKPPKRRFLTRLRVIGLVLGGFLLAFAVIAELTIAPTLRRKLESAVAAHLDASLSIGRLTYRPPFTVHLYDVKFIAHPGQRGGGAELLSARRIDLSLAKLPLGEGPIVIERFALDGLTVHVIRNADGKYLGLDLGRGSGTASSSPEAMKLSDVLRLRHFSLKDGTLIYQDESGPTRWGGLSSEITLAPQSASLYGFELSAADAPIATANLNGNIDVNSLFLQIKSFTASVQSSDPASTGIPDSLPPALREVLHRYSVLGKISLRAMGTIPLNNPDLASITADFGIAGASAQLPDHSEKLSDLALATHIESNTPGTNGEPIRIDLTHFRAVSRGAILHLSSAVLTADPSIGKWSISGLFGSLDAPPENHGPWALTGHADFHADIAHDDRSDQTPITGAVNLIGINLSPPGLAAPLQNFTGSLHFSGTDAHDRQITLQNFTADYGGDRLALDHAKVTLDHFPDSIDISGIQSHLDLVQDAPQCPGDLGAILKSFQPSGDFQITGTAVMRHVIRDDGPGYSPDWNLNVSTENGDLALMDEQLPLTNINCTMLATKSTISVASLHGTLLGGAMSLVGKARVVEPINYEGDFNVQGASVQRFAQSFKIPAEGGHLPTGVANLRFQFASSASPTTAGAQGDSDADEWLSPLAGDGSLQIDDGNLWTLPVLQRLSGHTKIASESLTAGEAAAIFSIADRTIHFKRLAVYSPALGLQGSGTESFGGNLDLDIVAAPLGDWKQKLAETDIPFFSRVLSSAAGGLEKLVGSATSELLYHFRITGTREDPIVQTIPAPFLTDYAANLFSKMMHHDDNTKLVDSVGDK
jgi:hypothetical protein